MVINRYIGSPCAQICRDEFMFENQMVDVDIKMDTCCLFSSRNSEGILNVADFADGCIVHSMVPCEYGTAESLF